MIFLLSKKYEEKKIVVNLVKNEWELDFSE